MFKKIFVVSAAVIALFVFMNVAQAQVFDSKNGIGDSTTIDRDNGGMCEAENNGFDIAIDAAAAAARPAGCVLVECWMTCNVPGIGNTYESALQCGGTTQTSLRNSCRLAGGTVTTLSCRGRGYSSSFCAPPRTNPAPIPGPLPW